MQGNNFDFYESYLKKFHPWLKSPLGPLVIALVAALFFLTAVSGETAEPKAPEPQRLLRRPPHQ